MTEAMAAIFVASLLGSTHCAVMCGPIALIAARNPGEHGRPRVVHAITYHMARLGVYIVIGVSVGAMGAAVDRAGWLIGIQRGAIVLAGATLIVFGSMTLARTLGIGARVRWRHGPAWFGTMVGRAHRWTARRGPAARSLMLGMVTGLLPCGWLWAFAAVAASTGEPIGGALVMSAFWAGTVPAVAAVGLGADRLLRRAGVTGRLAAVLIVIAAGVWMLTGSVVAGGPGAHAGHSGGVLNSEPECHDASSVPDISHAEQP